MHCAGGVACWEHVRETEWVQLFLNEEEGMKV
jgi:hypothetical protein